MTISHRLREARIKAGFRSAAAAANAFGWTVSSYCSHENGNRGVRLDALKRYARAFNVDLIWLLLDDSSEQVIIGEMNDDTAPAETRPVPVVELASAAGAGAEVLSEEIKGYAWFRSSWLADHGLDHKQCVIIGVKGESMEPTLMDGCSILMDRTRTRRRAGRIYVIRTDDGLVAKRLDHDKTGAWLLKSDHPQWPPVPWSNDMTIIGQILWTARTLTVK